MHASIPPLRFAPLPAISGRSNLVRIRGLPILEDPDLPLLLVDDVLDPDFPAVLLFEISNESRIPELGSDAEVLAAPHQGVGLATLPSSGDGFFGKVLTFSSGLGDESAYCDTYIFVSLDCI